MLKPLATVALLGAHVIRPDRSARDSIHSLHPTDGKRHPPSVAGHVSSRNAKRADGMSVSIRSGRSGGDAPAAAAAALVDESELTAMVDAIFESCGGSLARGRVSPPIDAGSLVANNAAGWSAPAAATMDFFASLGVTSSLPTAIAPAVVSSGPSESGETAPPERRLSASARRRSSVATTACRPTVSMPAPIVPVTRVANDDPQAARAGHVSSLSSFRTLLCPLLRATFLASAPLGPAATPAAVEAADAAQQRKHMMESLDRMRSGGGMHGGPPSTPGAVSAAGMSSRRGLPPAARSDANSIASATPQSYYVVHPQHPQCVVLDPRDDADSDNDADADVSPESVAIKRRAITAIEGHYNRMEKRAATTLTLVHRCMDPSRVDPLQDIYRGDGTWLDPLIVLKPNAKRIPTGSVTPLMAIREEIRRQQEIAELYRPKDPPYRGALGELAMKHERLSDNSASPPHTRSILVKPMMNDAELDAKSATPLSLNDDVARDLAEANDAVVGSGRHDSELCGRLAVPPPLTDVASPSSQLLLLPSSSSTPSGAPTDAADKDHHAAAPPAAAVALSPIRGRLHRGASGCGRLAYMTMVRFVVIGDGTSSSRGGGNDRLNVLSSDASGKAAAAGWESSVPADVLLAVTNFSELLDALDLLLSEAHSDGHVDPSARAVGVRETTSAGAGGDGAILTALAPFHAAVQQGLDRVARLSQTVSGRHLLFLRSSAAARGRNTDTLVGTRRRQTLTIATFVVERCRARVGLLGADEFTHTGRITSPANCVVSAAALDERADAVEWSHCRLEL